MPGRGLKPNTKPWRCPTCRGSQRQSEKRSPVAVRSGGDGVRQSISNGFFTRLLQGRASVSGGWDSDWRPGVIPPYVRSPATPHRTAFPPIANAPRPSAPLLVGTSTTYPACRMAPRYLPGKCSRASTDPACSAGVPAEDSFNLSLAGRLDESAVGNWRCGRYDGEMPWWKCWGESDAD
jgi:hypothetical protein